MMHDPNPARRLTLRGIISSAGFYPLTALWIVATVLLMLLAEERIAVGTSIILFSAASIIALLYATLRELRAVHKLVDGQRAELVARIDQLVTLLIVSGVVVPPAGMQEAQARQDVSPTALPDANAIKWNDAAMEGQT